MSGVMARLQAAAAAARDAAVRARHRTQPHLEAAWSATKASARALRVWVLVDRSAFPLSSFYVDGKPAPLRHLAYQDFRMWLTRAQRASLLAAVFGSLFYGYVAWDLWRNRRRAVADRTVLGVFESGYVPNKFIAQDAAATVDRPQLHAQLLELLRPARSNMYALVVGAHGTGKSTAVRKAAREAPASGPHGVVYVDAEKVSEFGTQLMDALSMKRGTLDVVEGVRRKAMQEEAKAPDADPKHEPMASWALAAAALDTAATAFRNKHGRPMTLVIDNAQKIVQRNPAFLDVLQDFAKGAADTGNLRVVFVSSDFAVLTHMEGRSEWSRCLPVEIGEADVGEPAAIAYLTSKMGWTADDNAAAYIVANITGTRFSLLNSVTPAHGTLEAAKAWFQAHHDKTVEALSGQHLSAGHPLFSRMLDAPGQKLRRLALVAAGVTVEQRAALVKANVLAAHVDGTYTCSARHVVKTFEQLRDAAVVSADAARAASARPLA